MVSFSHICRAFASFGLVCSASIVTTTVHALDYGPFTLTGFAKAEIVTAGNQCEACQRFPGENRHRLWADDLVVGEKYQTSTDSVTLFQPWIAYNQRLGGGFEAHALLSQRWRDGKTDIPGAWYEKNVAISHEEWGRLALGAMTSRAWSLADYPFGSDIGVADAWSSSGAGYGLLTSAVRYTSRPYDVFEGDLVAEVSYDRGDNAFKRNAPRLIELWIQYRRGSLALDFIGQDSRNGNPQAWGHGPFTALTANPSDDEKLGGSGQSISMAMLRYDVRSDTQISIGARHNRWSGAYAVLTEYRPDGNHLWNNMFNVDWNGVLNGVSNPGYSASTNDVTLGVRHTRGAFHYSAGYVHLSKSKTDNPSERGQSNHMNMLVGGVGTEVVPKVRVYALVGMVRYGNKGLAPLSMPSHSAFSGVDSRVTQSGRWAGLGVVYTF